MALQREGNVAPPTQSFANCAQRPHLYIYHGVGVLYVRPHQENNYSVSHHLTH